MLKDGQHRIDVIEKKPVTRTSGGVASFFVCLQPCYSHCTDGCSNTFLVLRRQRMHLHKAQHVQLVLREILGVPFSEYMAPEALNL
jgi:hypothetical protein